MIEQIKTYRVTCSEWAEKTMDGREYAEECGATVIVQGTSRHDALRQLPDDWRWTNDNGSDVVCPRSHWE